MSTSHLGRAATRLKILSDGGDATAERNVAGRTLVGAVLSCRPLRSSRLVLGVMVEGRNGEEALIKGVSCNLGA